MAPCSFVSIEQGFCVSLTGLPRRAATSPVEQQVVGDIVAALGMKQSHPVLMANHLTEPHDFIPSALRISGEALLLLG